MHAVTDLRPGHQRTLVAITETTTWWVPVEHPRNAGGDEIAAVAEREWAADPDRDKTYDTSTEKLPSTIRGHVQYVTDDSWPSWGVDPDGTPRAA